MSIDERAALHLGAHEGPNDNLNDAVYGSGDPQEKFFKGLEAFINVGIGMGDAIDRQTEELRKTRVNLQRNTIVDASAVAAGVYPASGNLILNLGSPDAGVFWEVNHISVGGTDVNVAAAGSAGVYVSGTTLQSGGMLSNRDYTSFLPNSAYYGTHQFVIVDQENLLVVIFGGTAGQQYAAVAHISALPDNSAQGKNVGVI